MTTDASSNLPFGLDLPPRAPRERWEEINFPDPARPRLVEVGIPLRDGVEVAADVYLPAASELPAPAIVVGTPYDKSSAFDDERNYRDIGNYVVVIYDYRGRGKSEGEWRPRVSAGKDGYDVVEWVAGQPWCNGDVGVCGTSYSGFVAWATTAEKPPHLKANVTVSAVGRMMEEIPYTNGCFWLYYICWWAMCRRRINDSSIDVNALLDTLPVDAAGEVLNVAGPGWRDYMDHDHLDEYWKAQRWDGEYDFDIPSLHISGWFDREDLIGTFHHYEQMMEKSPARDKQWLLIGPWSHVSARVPSSEYLGFATPEAALDMDGIHVRFFDRFLRGIDNGVDEEPRVRLYDTGERRWSVREAWDGGTSLLNLHLGSGGQLVEESPIEGQQSYEYDPMNAPGLRFDTSEFPWEPSLDLSALESQDGVVAWTTESIGEALTLRGGPTLDLWAATDGDDTDWHVKLADVGPDGVPLQLAWGCLRASHGSSLSEPTPVTPGAPVLYKMWLTPVFHTLAAGHKLRLILSSADYPWFARNLNRFEPIAHQSEPRIATNTVYFGGAHASNLHIPIEDGAQPAVSE